MMVKYFIFSISKRKKTLDLKTCDTIKKKT